MERDVMMFWIRSFLEKATDKQLEYLMYFIRGYLRLDELNQDKKQTV